MTDVESELVPQYLAERILPYNPFATVDPGACLTPVEMGVELGHEGNPDIVCGVCGEHARRSLIPLRSSTASVSTTFPAHRIVRRWLAWLLLRLRWQTNNFAVQVSYA